MQFMPKSRKAALIITVFVAGVISREILNTTLRKLVVKSANRPLDDKTTASYSAENPVTGTYEEPSKLGVFRLEVTVDSENLVILVYPPEGSRHLTVDGTILFGINNEGFRVDMAPVLKPAAKIPSYTVVSNELRGHAYPTHSELERIVYTLVEATTYSFTDDGRSTILSIGGDAIICWRFQSTIAVRCPDLSSGKLEALQTAIDERFRVVFKPELAITAGQTVCLVEPKIPSRFSTRQDPHPEPTPVISTDEVADVFRTVLNQQRG